MSSSIASGYDAIAEAYAARLFGELENKPFDRDFLNRFNTAARPGGIVDMGCGPGHVARFLRDLGREVSGMDISPAMVDCARRLNPGLRFELGDMRSLALPAAQCSGIVAFYSIIHLAPEDLKPVFKAMRRALVPGGVLALAFHVGNEVRRIEELWGVKTCLDFVFFEPEFVTAALRETGFAVFEQTCRPPYAPAVEAQTRRCYVLATSSDTHDGV